MDFDKYITKSTVRWKMVLKIVVAILCLIGGGVAGYWIGGGFHGTSKTMAETDFENYIDANIDRLKIELDCIIEQNLMDLEFLDELSEHINNETAALEKRLKRIAEYKEELNEMENVIDTINDNLNYFRPDN